MAARGETSVPSRPRLLPGIPVLRRGDGELQIGTDPQHAVVLSGLTAPLAHRLGRLDGSLTRADLLEDTAPDDRAALLAVLRELARARLVEDADAVTRPRTTNSWYRQSREPATSAASLTADARTWALRSGQPTGAMGVSRARACVAIHGNGRIAIAVGVLLAAAGVGWVRVAARGVVTPEDVGSGYLAADVGTERATAAAQSVERCADSVRTAALPDGTMPDLAVLADCAVPDPPLVASLLMSGTTHLLVHAREGSGIVGPLVFPHTTSCLHCLDLHRTDRDPAWPMVAAQLVGHTQQADLPTASAAASFAAGQALRVLDDGPSCSQAGEGHAQAVSNGAIELNPFDAELRRRQFVPHPDCDCGAANRFGTTGR